MKTIYLNRLEYNEKQVTGELVTEFGTLLTLELADLNNQPRISCIPKGVYTCVYRYSDKFKKHFHVKDVPNRQWILINSGNFYSDIAGCILVGIEFGDINSDGYKDVLNSRLAMKKLLQWYPLGFNLVIK
jgi:hypothetical protein